MDFNTLHSGLYLESELLTKELAYFLGSLISSNEFLEKENIKYYCSPVRYHKPKPSDEDFENHFTIIKKLSQVFKKKTYTSSLLIQNNLNSGKFNLRMSGFATLFDCDKSFDLTSIENLESIKQLIIFSNKDIKQSFILGFFDGRCSFDIDKEKKTLRYIVLDCDNDIILDFAHDIILDYFGFKPNLNRARERVLGGKPRKPQIRLGKNFEFHKNIGFLSPVKIKVLHDCKNLENLNIKYTNLMFGHKILD